MYENMMASSAGGVFDIEIHDVDGSDQDQSDDESIELDEVRISTFF